MEGCETYNDDEELRKSEDYFKKILNPIEPLVMRVQSWLVWEYPRRSAVLFICVHGIFCNALGLTLLRFTQLKNRYWQNAGGNLLIAVLTGVQCRLLATFGCRFYCMVSTITFIIYMIHTWKHKIWPEIRVPPKEPEDPDGWTPVHPRLLSVPELCQYLAQIWNYLSRILKNWLLFRRKHPFLFCVVSSLFFLIFAVIGHYISGFMLTYIIIISSMLWPCVLYHNLLQKVYLRFEPVFMKLDYSIKLKNKWSFKSPKSSKGSSAGDKNETDSDTEDFCPSLDPETTAALARAITDSEDESGTPSLSTPYCLSKEPSIDLNEDEGDRHQDFEADFASGIVEMPSFDDVLDHTDDELLDPIPIKPKPKSSNGGTQAKPGDMNFITEHFGDSTDSEDETLIRDLNFPDLNETGNNTSEGNMASVAGAYVSQTLTSMMGSALSGISNLKPNIMGKSSKGDNPDGQSGMVYSKDGGDITIQSSAHDNPGDLQADVQQISTESSDLDIAEEFEFLDQYELDENK